MGTALEASIDLSGLEDALRAIVREELGSRDAEPACFLHVPDAARLLGLSEDALRALVKRDAIPFHKKAGRLFFDPSELDAWVRS